MTEGPEVDDRVDYEDDNYMEDEDDVDADPSEDEDEDGTGDEKCEEQYDELSESSAKEQLSEVDQSPYADKHVEDEEKHATSADESDREKHEELLSLPPHGSEVFIGGLPRDLSEEDLSDLCEPFGEICEVRLMKDKSTGENKGYAFVAFQATDIAQRAIEQLKGTEFKGKSLRCSLSESKHRLFVGNIPKAWSEEQFRQVIHDVGPGAEIIDLKQDASNPGRNRGFAFIEYYNNACADYARQKMSNGTFKLEGNTPTVTWADPKTAPENSAAASQVKALYVKNIPDNATPEQLKELFQRHGEVTKVVLPPAKGGQAKGNFGFIHFSERSSALKAIKDSEKYKVDGQKLEVTMAKPQADKKSEAAAFNGASEIQLLDNELKTGPTDRAKLLAERNLARNERKKAVSNAQQLLKDLSHIRGELKGSKAEVGKLQAEAEKEWAERVAAEEEKKRMHAELEELKKALAEAKAARNEAARKLEHAKEDAVKAYIDSPADHTRRAADVLPWVKKGMDAGVIQAVRKFGHLSPDIKVFAPNYRDLCNASSSGQPPQP